MFTRLNQLLISIETWLAAGSLLTLLLLSLFQIVFRNVFEYGFPEIDIINRNLLVVCGMMGATIATSRYAHIKTDALSILIPASVKPFIQPVIVLFAAISCAAMCYFAILFVLDEWQYMPANERWTLPFTLIYPFAFALMSFHFIANEIDNSANNTTHNNSVAQQ